MFNQPKQYINGAWVDSHSQETIAVINPATEAAFGTIAKGNAQDVEDAVQAANNVYLNFVILLSTIVNSY